MNQNQFNEFFQDFLIEGTERLQEFESNLLLLESTVRSKDFSFHHIEEPIQSIFRSVHTIKGLAGMLDLDAIKTYGHEAENLLDQIRCKTIPVTEPLVGLLFNILDTLKALIGSSVIPDQAAPDITIQVEKIALFLRTEGIVSSAEEKKKMPTRDNTDDLGIVNNVKALTATTIRVDTERLDNLLTIVGELVIAKNRLMQVVKDDQNRREDSLIQTLDSDEGSAMADTASGITRLINHLQETSMRLRMVPVGYSFKKFERTIRDIAKKHGKEVQFSLVGETTEVDRFVIEVMEDPLVHLLRNAVDHGIEASEERKAAGKPKEGRIILSARQESNMIVVTIEDDGRGMDAEKIYASALRKGIVEPNSNWNDKDKINLIFLPGFSTAEKVTELSGRGVGMDVVKKSIQKVGGLIEVQTELGKGSRFILKLPLTLAIIQVLMVEVGRQRFSVPLNNVVEILRIPVSDVQYLNGGRAIELRGQVLPLVTMHESLGIDFGTSKSHLFVIVVGLSEQRIGLIVDGFGEQQDVVIKSLGSYLEKMPEFSGATILGDGRVSLVLDIASVIRLALESGVSATV
jgi:two-component system chemotaxis sensor kinase CheA